MYIRKNLFLLISLLSVLFLVYNKWFFSLDILSSGDWMYYFNESQMNLYKHSFSIWRNNSGFGNIALDIGQAPISFIYGILAKVFSFNFALSERIVHMFPIAILNLISSFLLLQHLLKNRFAIFIGVIYYMFNTYFLVGQTGHLTLMTAYSIAPLALYFYMKSLAVNKIPLSVITVLLFSLLGTYEPRASYIISGVLFLYFLFYIFTLERLQKKSEFLIKILYAFIPFIIFGILNLYWIYALANIGAITSNSLFSRVLYGGDLFSINYSLSLFHPFWSNSAIEIFTAQPIIFYFWLYPLLAILGLMLNRKNKDVVFFGLIALVGIFLTKQSDVPFPNLYAFLYANFPGFNAFREASKFYFLTALGYSVLIAAFFQWLWENWNKKKWQIYAKYVLTVIIIFTILWNTKPLITGEIGTLFVGRKTPNDFLIVKDFIIKQDGYFRTLWTPVSSRWSFYTAQNPQVSTISLVNGEWKQFIPVDLKRPEVNNILELFKTEDFEYLLDTSATRYVIVTSRTKGSEEDWIGEKNNRLDYINVLDEISHLKKINIGTKEITIYENTNFKPHLYLTQEKESLEKYVSVKPATHTFINPTRYKISLKSISSPLFLNFSESYHPQWRLRAGEFNWFDVLTDKNYFLTENIHTRSDAGFNTYLIDPEGVCKNYECRKNSDGSYDIEMTLYFAPQSHLYLGMIISGSTLLLCLGYLAYYGIKKAKSKK